MPGVVDEATLIDMVEVPAPVIEVGLKVTVTPVGWPLADKLIAPSNPPVTELVMVEVPILPCATVTEDGEAERLKPDPPEPPASAVIKSAPVGTAPAGRQIVSGSCRIAVAATGDVVEVGGIARSQTNRIEGGIDEARLSCYR